MRVTTAQEIGLAIRQRRKELGLSQQALADRVAVGRQWIVEVEQGKPRAEIGLLLRTLDALALHVTIASEKDTRETAPKRSLPGAHQRQDVDIDAIIKRARTWWT
jgi:HTH-type transcriptional regulator/antitoxin HipB